MCSESLQEIRSTTGGFPSQFPWSTTPFVHEPNHVLPQLTPQSGYGYGSWAGVSDRRNRGPVANLNSHTAPMVAHAHQTAPFGTHGTRSGSLRTKNRDALPLRHSRGRGRKMDPTIRLVITPYYRLLTKREQRRTSRGRKSVASLRREKGSTEGMRDVLLARNRLTSNLKQL